MAQQWVAASDHAGLHLRRELVAHLRELGDQVEDLGPDDESSVDYPDFAKALCDKVSGSEALGILVCGTGNGIAISANKCRGIRAAIAVDSFTGRMARLHNDANVIVMGARVIGGGVAVDALNAFRDARFEGGRHQRRVDKMMALE